MNKIDCGTLEECIREILDISDLKSITTKAIRIKLQEKLSQDFSNDKSEIDKLIIKLYNERLSKEDEDSSSLDDEIETITKKRKPTNPTKKDSNKKKPDSKSAKNDQPQSAKSISSGSSIINNDDDAEIARALQAEINGMRTVRKSTQLLSSKSKQNKKNKSDRTGPPRRVGGFCKTINLSSELSKYLGAEQMTRHDVVKRLWEIAREKNMFDPANRQFVLCDDDWQRLFLKKRIRMFAISKFLEKHFIRD